MDPFVVKKKITCGEYGLRSKSDGKEKGFIMLNAGSQEQDCLQRSQPILEWKVYSQRWRSVCASRN